MGSNHLNDHFRNKVESERLNEILVKLGNTNDINEKISILKEYLEVLKKSI
jgi:hypothetical protein